MKYALRIQVVDGDMLLTDDEGNVIVWDTKKEAKEQQKIWANSIIVNYDDGSGTD